mmetsp:Transcript_63752/g.120684  ORF Transcript_63752/g.120684 Transcript_63752/m.120684 type:complete len:123 (-) Transcript_63752:446-814(-)
MPACPKFSKLCLDMMRDPGFMQRAILAIFATMVLENMTLENRTRSASEKSTSNRLLQVHSKAPGTVCGKLAISGLPTLHRASISAILRHAISARARESSMPRTLNPTNHAKASNFPVPEPRS